MSSSECNRQPSLFDSPAVVALLQQSKQPIEDHHNHLVPFCELLEAAFTKGLKCE